MQQFDPKTYPKMVLAPYKDGGDPDMFERYLLELDDSSRIEIEKRLEAVSQWCANNINKYAPYKALITRMRNEHSTAKVRLLDEAARAQLAAEVKGARGAAQAAQYAKLDRALEQLHDEYQ